MSVCRYVNADFDLSLRSDFAGEVPRRLQRQIRELTLQALLGARADDAALLREPVEPAFLEHLRASGLTLPRIVNYPRIDPALEFSPFGWSAEAIELNARQASPVAHPPLEVVRRVNARSFQLGLEEDPGRSVGDLAEVERRLAAQPGEWLFKGAHGASGLANRRLRTWPLTVSDRRFIVEQFAGGRGAALELWRDRECDYAATFSVPFDPATFRAHESICTRDGAVIGGIFGAELPEGWTAELRRTAERVARGLTEAGYFGSVCMDAFSWRDGETIRFRPLVDLNCRQSILAGAARMQRKLAADRTLYYRFFNRRKLRLPRALPEALTLLATERYDPATRRGVLLATPTHFNKIAIGFFGVDLDDAFAQERRFRAKFEP